MNFPSKIACMTKVAALSHYAGNCAAEKVPALPSGIKKKGTLTTRMPNNDKPRNVSSVAMRFMSGSLRVQTICA
jgi:hypothetical protein